MSEAMHRSRGETKIGCTGCLGLLAVAVVLVMALKHEGPLPETAKPAALSPQQQRMADLKRKREGIGVALEMQKETLKQILRDEGRLDWVDRADPDVRREFKERLDNIERRLADLSARLDAVNAEIATAEGDAGPPTRPTVDPAPDPAPAP